MLSNMLALIHTTKKGDSYFTEKGLVLEEGSDLLL